MSIIDWLIVALIVASLVELAVEIRRKRWSGAVMSALFAALLIAIGWRILVYLARQLVGTSP